MSKEEYLKKHLWKKHYVFSATITEEERRDYQTALEEAMQEYADQQSLEYYQWRSNLRRIDMVVNVDSTDRRILTEAELLTRFKERP